MGLFSPFLILAHHFFLPIIIISGSVRIEVCPSDFIPARMVFVQRFIHSLAPAVDQLLRIHLPHAGKAIRCDSLPEIRQDCWIPGMRIKQLYVSEGFLIRIFLQPFDEEFDSSKSDSPPGEPLISGS
ncbi:hypothetical protein BGX38DRAFT_1227780 [Terfezia claveryi]|nr:hypothetical protein BGX38DRAFT_1227780 [Terfezia claveryi]